MNLLNKTIIIKPLVGQVIEAKIINQDGDKFYIDRDKKTYTYPDSFKKFIKFKDEKLQNEVEAEIAARVEADDKAQAERYEKVLRDVAEARRIEQEKAESARRKKGAPTVRYANENNIAFKCNFCNGGCGTDCIGYMGACSDDIIKYNIEKKNRAWCSKEISPCRQYLEGKITRAELDAINASDGFVCYESKMLTDWVAEAGDDVDEHGNMRARRITNASRESLAVLTTEMPSLVGGKNRVIFGVFITDTVDEGDELKAGYVKAKPGYTIELTPEEAKKMKFWHYYKNPNSERIQWSTGLYRYMKDSACARILADIADIKVGAEKVHAKEVLEYYCALKGIDAANIPEADGIL